MKNLFKLSLLVVTMMLLLPNCATIVSKTNYPVKIVTEPNGATVSISNRKGIEIYKGSTPAFVMLKSGAGFFTPARYQVRINLEGYAESVVNITSSLNGWYLGNLLIGGLIGMVIVDPATGAMWRIDQKFLNVNLVPSNQQALNIININDLPEGYKDHLIRIN